MPAIVRKAGSAWRVGIRERLSRTYNLDVEHNPPRIGISACLLGQPVRYDSGHKRDSFLVETFGPHVEWIPICPEVEAGFGTPRETMRLMLVRPQTRARGERFDTANLALVLNKQGTDVT